MTFLLCMSELLLVHMVQSLDEVDLVYLRCEVPPLWLVVRRLLMMMCTGIRERKMLYVIVRGCRGVLLRQLLLGGGRELK